MMREQGGTGRNCGGRCEGGDGERDGSVVDGAGESERERKRGGRAELVAIHLLPKGKGAKKYKKPKS